MTFPATNWFRKTLEDSLERTAVIDWNADTFKAAMFLDAVDGASANFDTGMGYGTTPWGANEVTGTAYTAGGVALATPAVTVASGVVKFAAGNAVWNSSTISNAQGTLVYDDTLSAGSKYGIVAVNFGGPFSSVSGTFTIQWNAAGILTFS